MKKSIKNSIAEFLCACGLPDRIRKKNAKNKVTIINYHDPSGRVFESHIKRLLKHYTPVSIDAVEKSFMEHDFTFLPDYPLLITFDDGHIGNYQLLPVFKEYKIPAVVYVTAGLTGTSRHFWWKEIRECGLNDKVECLKELSSVGFCNELYKLCGYEYEKEYPTRQALNWEELRELHAAGITIGAHSVNHPILSQCSSEEIQRECSESKRILEDGLQTEIRHFALPNGNGNPAVLKSLKGSGYHTNRTIRPGWNSIDTDLFELNDFGIADNGSSSYAFLQATGTLDRIRNSFLH